MKIYIELASGSDRSVGKRKKDVRIITYEFRD